MPTIAIVGAGLGGLAAANGLLPMQESHGAKVVVVERDTSATSRPQGYYIGLQKWGLDALKEVGCLDGAMEYAKRAREKHSTAFTFLTAAGDELMKLVPSDDPEDKFAATSMHRQRLREALLRPVEDKVVWGYELVEMNEKQDKMELVFANGDIMEADIVIGADGVNSVVRKLALDEPTDTRRDVQLRSLGGAVVDEGQLDDLPNSQGTFMVMEKGPSLFIGRYVAEANDGIKWQKEGDVVLNWGLATATPSKELRNWLHPWVKEEVDLAEFREEAVKTLRGRGWHDSILSMMEGTPIDQVRVRDLWDREPMSEATSWGLDKVTLIGDAAHPMLPYQGAGGNTAIVDGVQLARLLQTESSMTGALRKYEKDMFTRSAKYVNTSYKMAELMHTTSPFKATVRNWMFKLGGTLMKLRT